MINLMIDIETTGTYAEKHAIIQIGAVPFDIEKRELGESFCQCLLIPEDRCWLPSTKQWWEDTNPYKLAEILSKGEDHICVLENFRDYVFSFGKGARFWSHHPMDWEMIQNYFRSYNLQSPFNYRSFIDLDSYLEALVPEDIGKYKPVADLTQQHDAIYDCLHQIFWLFNTLDKKEKYES